MKKILKIMSVIMLITILNCAVLIKTVQAVEDIKEYTSTKQAIYFFINRRNKI